VGIAFYAWGARPGGQEVVTAEFIRCTSFRMGFPNDEALHGHPLWGHGLEAYRAHEVSDSAWLGQLRTIEAAHPQAPAVPFENARHFVLTFHDSTVEAILSRVATEPSGTIVCDQSARLRAGLRTCASISICASSTQRPVVPRTPTARVVRHGFGGGHQQTHRLRSAPAGGSL
jgi:hypothetical protein